MKTAKRIISKFWPYNKLITSDIKIPWENIYKPDGTASIITNHYYIKRCKEGEDQENLNQWSYLTLEGQQQSKITIYQ